MRQTSVSHFLAQQLQTALRLASCDACFAGALRTRSQQASALRPFALLDVTEDEVFRSH